MAPTALRLVATCLLLVLPALADDSSILLQTKLETDQGEQVPPNGAVSVAKTATSHAAYHWAGKNGDARRTGSSSAVAPSAISGGPTWSFHEQVPDWLYQMYPSVRKDYPEMKGLIRAAPLIDDKSNIYLTTVTFGNIYKFSREGKLLWNVSASEGKPENRQLPDIGAIMDGKLFVSTDKAEVLALDMETGKQLWNQQVPDTTKAAGDTWAMAAGDGVIITAVMKQGNPSGNNNRLVAMDASDGSHKWSFDPEGGDIYNILVSIKDGSCVFSTATGKVYRLQLDSGKVLWETEMPKHPSFTTGGTVVGPNGKVYVTWNEQNQKPGEMQWGKGMVGAFDFATGKKLWTTDVEYEANNAAAVGRLADGRLGLVVGLGSNPNSPDKSKGIADGKGPVKKQRITAIDAETGSVRWTYQLPDWHGSALGDEKRPDICLPDAFGNPAIGGDGTTYVGHASGNLFSINDKNSDGTISESEVATWQTGAAFQGSPGIAPQMLVATPCNGMHVWLSK